MGALEEQLTARCRLMEEPSNLPLPSFKNCGFVRSASSSVFSLAPSLGGESAFTDELSKVNSAFSSDFCDSQTSRMNSNPPGMVQSSQSDNSSDGNENDDASFTRENPEDFAAGEWAAALVAVADQSMDKENALLYGRVRSTSESSASSSRSSESHESKSSNSLAKSPVGFWYVRPGSSMDGASEHDENHWSPSLESSGHPVQESLLGSDDDPSHLLSPCGFSASNLGKLLTKSSSGVGNNCTSALDESSHPSSNAGDELDSITLPILPLSAVASISSFKPMQSKTICRSISYSAFSTCHNLGMERSTDPKPKLLGGTSMCGSLSLTQENDVFRTYFLKFIDLLIFREMGRLVHSKGA